MRSVRDLDLAISEGSRFVEGVVAGLIRIGALDERRADGLRKEWASRAFRVLFGSESELAQIAGTGQRLGPGAPLGRLRRVIPLRKGLPVGRGELTVSALEVWTDGCVVRGYFSLPREVIGQVPPEDRVPTLALRDQRHTSYLLRARAVRGVGGFYPVDDVFAPPVEEGARGVTIDVIDGTGSILADIEVATGGG